MPATAVACLMPFVLVSGLKRVLLCGRLVECRYSEAHSGDLVVLLERVWVLVIVHRSFPGPLRSSHSKPRNGYHSTAHTTTHPERQNSIRTRSFVIALPFSRTL
jgi:hypothetical protein